MNAPSGFSIALLLGFCAVRECGKGKWHPKFLKMLTYQALIAASTLSGGGGVVSGARTNLHFFHLVLLTMLGDGHRFKTVDGGVMFDW